MEEIWLDVKDYEGLYQISNYGRVKSLNKYDASGHLRKEKILDGGFDIDGYLRVHISKNGKKKRPGIHILVAEAFIPNPENKPIVHHIDYNKENNHVDNLMWVTEKEHNTLHHKGKHHSEEAKGKISETLKGREFSEEHRKKLSEALKKPILQLDLNGNIIREWDSMTDVQKELGYSNGNISRCCNGKLKQAYGFKWCYSSTYTIGCVPSPLTLVRQGITS